MNKQEVYDLGYQRGYNIASWQDIPDIGDKVPKEIDWVGISIIHDENDIQETLSMQAHASEENDRSFSSFEITAKTLNDLEETTDFEPWAVFESGIHKGIIDNFLERYESNEK